MINLEEKRISFLKALDSFIERIKEDRWILAAVLVGSINEDTILEKEHLYLWIIEADGVTLRKKSDGEEHRIWRTMVEHDINVWAEIIPRSRFKRMVEGSSRTAFSYNFFAKRELVYSADDSIKKWFEETNKIAQKDKELELLIATTWVAVAAREALKLIDIEKDLSRGWQKTINAAHALASVHVVEEGEICESPVIHRALEINPALFSTIYSQLIEVGPSEKHIRLALGEIEKWLDDKGSLYMKPLLAYLKKQSRVVGLTELANHFAFTQLYPWHIESACEWMVRANRIEKLATEMPLTKKSRIQLEEPAYLYNVD